eukprot:jgi/Mesvir1/22142/Mv18744-RA.1
MRGSDAVSSSFFRTASWPIDKKFSISEATARKLLTAPEKTVRAPPTASEAMAACAFGAFVRSGRVYFTGWEEMCPTPPFFEALETLARLSGITDEPALALIRDYNKHQNFWSRVMDYFSAPDFRIQGQLHKGAMAHMNVNFDLVKEPLALEPDSVKSLVVVKEKPEATVFYQVFLHINTLLFMDLDVPDFHIDLEDSEDVQPLNAYSGTWPGYFWYRGVRNAVKDEKTARLFDWQDAHPDWPKEFMRDVTHSFHFVRYPQILLDWLNAYRAELSDKLYARYPFLPREEDEDVFYTCWKFQDWPTMEFEQDMDPWVAAPEGLETESYAKFDTKTALGCVARIFVEQKCDVGADKSISAGDLRKALFVDFLKMPKLAHTKHTSNPLLASVFQELGFRFCDKRTKIPDGRFVRSFFAGFDIKK